MKTCCIAVIGHVDHGKTALVHALTGTQTDRLPEEKARGLSIETGFAYKSYPAGTIDFIDTPGHEDFIQKMISGASGAAAVLLVVSAVDGIAAQTLEHLNIAGLLDIKAGVIAVTKSDMLPPSECAQAAEHIRKALSDSPFSAAPLILCSARNGDGIAALHDALQGVLAHATPPSAPLHSYLPIDRVFSLPGLGTIVTGTLLGQELRVGAPVALQPADREITLRGLQSRGAARDRIEVGERTAVNIRSLTVNDMARGDVICVAGTTAPTTCVDVHLELLPSAAHPLKHMQDLRVLFGTSGEVAQVRLFGGGQVAPAQSRLAQLRFKRPVVGFPGQRMILRRLSPSETIGGAVILDPLATETKAGDKTRLHLLEALKAQDLNRIAEALLTGGTARLADIARLSRMRTDAARTALGTAFLDLGSDVLCPKADVDARTAQLLSDLSAFHAKFPLKAMAPRTAITPDRLSPLLMRHIEKTLVASGQITVSDTQLALSTHDPVERLNAEQRARWIDIEREYQQAGLAPPSRNSLSHTDLDKNLVQLLIDTGRLVTLHNIALKQHLLLHRDALALAADTLRVAFPPPTRFTTGEARNALATSRRIIVPVLEFFDASGHSTRNGDMRQMTDPNDISTPSSTC